MAVGLKINNRSQAPGDSSLGAFVAKCDQVIGLLKNKKKLNEGIALYVKKDVKAHLVQYNADNPNRLGGDRTNFYSKAANSTNHESSETGCVVSISKIGIRLQILGGTVKAGRNTSSHTGKTTRALAIPADPRAHGHVPSEFTNLVFIPARNKGGNLVGMLCEVVEESVRLKKKKKPKNAEDVTEIDIVLARTDKHFRRVIFWLVKQTTIKPHPDVVPNREAILDAASRGADAIMSTVKQKQLPSSTP